MVIIVLCEKHNHYFFTSYRRYLINEKFSNTACQVCKHVGKMGCGRRLHLE